MNSDIEPTLESTQQFQIAEICEKCGVPQSMVQGETTEARSAQLAGTIVQTVCEVFQTEKEPTDE